MALLAVLGIVIGAFANHLIYRYAWFPRKIGPWGPAELNTPPRTPFDRIPIFGWLGLRRESSVHGRGYWIRPLLIELALAVCIPAYYWFQTQTGLLLPVAYRGAAQIAAHEPWMTQIFWAHAILITLMVAATFIDFDEQTIPDLLTIPGTLIALLLASFSLFVFLPASVGGTAPIPTLFFLPAALAPKWFGPTGWWTGFGIWTAWCFALANRRVILRRGPLKAIDYFFASLRRDPYWIHKLAMWIIGAVLIRIAFGISGSTWIGLLTALIGLGVGGGVVWAIRIVGSLAMRREALGFGDVTLMAMIGAFIGWQGAVISFFLAPIAAILIVLVYFIVTRNSEIPFGPYLCAGTLLTIFWWDRLLNGWFLGNLAILGPFMLWLFIALTGMMGVMLFVWRIFKERYLSE
ncbi:A24 family peptidase [Stieleria sp. TO1_6]|uniref:prepilin peptidase n=1 Tax=Stieleria tagensis TaxID=2956795 RepID=UPI00209A90E3|nr:A24 family peptidase [Stieleria tagensis]MCO8120744.1 A24 family peptidase [Stieleria tagensis]